MLTVSNPTGTIHIERSPSSPVEPRIIKIKELLLNNKLQVPNYQRPYKWNTKNVNQLIDDILLHQNKSAYRLGTLVLHKEQEGPDSNLNIVDGQQRAISLTLIAHALLETRTDFFPKMNGAAKTDYTPQLLNNFPLTSDITRQNIQTNYQEILRRMREFDEHAIYSFFYKCELVQVVLTDISEAFQFFDSQNSRGKDLEPHDLLKAFHLREMTSGSTEEEKMNSVATWEAMETGELADLFGIYLYRIRNWSKTNSARYFTKKEADLFKGITLQNKQNFPFAQLFRIGHFYTDHFNGDYQRNVDGQKMEFPFQIDQVIMNGKRFFEMVSYYKRLIDDIKSNQFYKKIEALSLNEKTRDKAAEIITALSRYEGRNRTGDQYVRVLFDCALIYYIDKFGTAHLPKAIEKLFIWAYSLRLQMQAVQLPSMDNHALENIQMFKIIREAVQPEDVLAIKLGNVPANRSTKTGDIVTLFKELQYFDGQ